MRFDPKSEKEVAEAGLLPLGNYDFEVVAAEEKRSEKGNDMIELRARVYDNDGQGRTIFDYLVHTDGGAYKVRHFAYAVGMGVEYEKGELRADRLVGATGKARVFIKKDKTKQYPDKNSISDYLPPTGNGAASHATAGDPRPAAPPFDDDIPF